MGVEFRVFDEVTDDFVHLADELDRELRRREGDLQDVYFGFNRLDGIRDVVLAYDGGVAVACGSFKRHDGVDAEVKRVFVQPSHRGRGLSKQLMGELEAYARRQGIGSFLVETAASFAEANGLYRSLGYKVVPNFPPYEGLDTSICYRKALS